MNVNVLQKKLHKHFGESVSVRIENRCIIVSGHLDSWDKIVAACSMCVNKKPGMHVVNDIRLDGVTIPEMRIPDVKDDSLDKKKPDVLIIGGGISGASIARELSKWKLDILLVDKEADLAVQASGRNDGEVHPGVDLNRGSLKQHYVLKGNRMFGRVCKELSVPFDRCGQYVGFTGKWMYPLIWAYVWQRRHICKVKDTQILKRDELFRREPNLNPEFQFAIFNPSAGCVCPYGLTIAYGENAVENGAKVSLNTAVLGMEVKNAKIRSVTTNRGTVYPKIVINAAGVFAEDVAKMAGDRFYSIHPRKGTNSILDKKSGSLVKGIASIKTLNQNTKHTKGGGILHTVHDNLLVGPNAVETYEKENFATEQGSIDAVFEKQKLTAGALSERDIITYFTGVRPATFEEDFVIEKGRRTKNLIHCAGIQSPGLTTAPAVALDIEKMVVKELSKSRKVERNRDFQPVRKAAPVLNRLSDEERNRLIQENPDYGEIVCRCEEISKGEILDALKSPIPVPTIDGIKKRVRPGMGRCQGGFCMPLVTKIISEYEQIPEEKVRKAGAGSEILLRETKPGNGEAVS
ncbi:FAD/NAD(P)-binding oxidoreductase [Clostridium sp. AF19-22AC]|jgi:glycerol-3-phosphate dehydrogenase|uniref:NAD(P)/FAD-dependent oxidoreductase n=1 Tax=Clostridia TaxID=186801 RepID=UPI000E4E8ED6|nr:MULTISPECIES: NAD(P)/FAD-dependent oxidoreductase [Clostridia]RHR27139.1 FAD/NAD(P)-binding oxidoreductase [Clostridium sp. AF19-22AC]